MKLNEVCESTLDRRKLVTGASTETECEKFFLSFGLECKQHEANNRRTALVARVAFLP